MFQYLPTRLLKPKLKCVVGTLSPKHNFKETLTKHLTLNNIYETINSKQDKTKYLYPSNQDLVTLQERITEKMMN